MTRVTKKEAFENLANAIIMKAVIDYKAALIKLRRCKTFQGRANARAVISECEAFFRSQWFGILTDLDPQMLIRKIKEEIT